VTSSPRLLAAGLVLAAVIACAIALVAQATGVLTAGEQRTVASRFALRAPATPGDIVLVAIDDTTFSDLQRSWPFPRSLHARVIDELRMARAGQIVYDVQFTEPTKRREDLALYNAIGDAGGAILATSESENGHTNVLGGDDNLRTINSRAAASPLLNDTSGAIASFPREVGGLESIAVAATKRLTGEAPDPEGFRGNKAWIDYRGPPGTVPTVSFSDVLNDRVPKSKIQGRIVVVGGTAPTLRDVHPTPVGGEELMAGAEVQANAIWTALGGLPLRSAAPLLNLAILILLAMLAPLARWRLPLGAVSFVTILAGAAFLAGAQLAFESGMILDIAAPLVALLIGAFGGLINGVLTVRTGINGFIITLATASAFTGINFGITESIPFYKMPAALVAFGEQHFGAFPYLLIAPLIVAALLGLFFARTVAGRQLLAYGGNPQAAELSGIPRDRTVVLAHVISGALAAIAAVLAVSQLGSAQPTIGADWLLLSFAAPIRGGAALTGGYISVLGTMFAVVLIALIENGMVLANVDPYWVQFLLGALILAAVGLNRWRALTSGAA